MQITDGTILNELEVKKAKKQLLKNNEINNISDFFKIFGDPTRLSILLTLIDHELSVGDLCNVLEMNKSAISHQLKYLKFNHLVKFKKVGKNVIYSLDDYHVSSIIDIAKSHLNERKK